MDVSEYPKDASGNINSQLESRAAAILPLLVIAIVLASTERFAISLSYDDLFSRKNTLCSALEQITVSAMSPGRGLVLILGLELYT